MAGEEQRKEGTTDGLFPAPATSKGVPPPATSPAVPERPRLDPAKLRPLIQRAFFREWTATGALLEAMGEVGRVFLSRNVGGDGWLCMYAVGTAVAFKVESRDPHTAVRKMVEGLIGDDQPEENNGR